MNQQERDELRAKHRVGQNEADNQCQSCYSPDGYPCDTIKVLDAWADTTEYPPEGQNVECDTWLGSRPHQASSRLHPGLDLTTVTTEAEVHDGSELSTTREVCDHLKSVATVEDDGAMCWYVFGYCPHCGERLDPTEQDLYRVANWSGTTDTGIPYVEKLTPTGTTLSNENGNL